MELALEFGMPVTGLARVMPERELGEWAAFRKRRMLPHRRLELLLAQLAMLVDARMGGVQHKSLSDYLFDPDSSELDQDDDAGDGGEITAADVAAQFGSTVYRKKV